MRSANPTLNKNTFNNLHYTGHNFMTIDGTVNKVFLLLLCVVFTASLVWNMVPAELYSSVMSISVVVGLVFVLVTVFKKEWSPVTAPLYALAEGAVLGAISAFLNTMYPGIVQQAVMLTFGTLFVLLFLYKSKIIKVTENFKMGVFAATGAIALVYLINFVMGFFGKSIPMIHSSGVFGIGFSLVVVSIAALNLVLDFDFIEQGAHHKAPKYMEWYCAFGLIVTLIWLYVEILRLLSKIRGRD